MNQRPEAIHHPSEGDSNLSPARRDWAERHLQGAGRKLVERDSELFLHQALSTPCLSAVNRCEGIWIEDTAGNRYLDFHGNNVHHIGYGHPRLIDAVTAQMHELPFAPRRFTNQPAVDLAEKLTVLAPPGLDRVLFATGGSDANEMALKLARAATGRFKTVSFWDAFHGAGFGAIGVGGEALFRSGPIGPLMPGDAHVPPFSCYRCPYGYADQDGRPDLDTCHMTCAEMVRYVLEKEGDVAAVIAEPVRSVPYLPPPGFWPAVRKACDDHGALLIFDDIPSGLGKTGKMFSCENFGVVPDIITLGKALGGGMLPIAAVIARGDLNVLGERALGHYTHEKNPVTARAALTTIDIIESEGLMENAVHVGAYALDRLSQMKNRHPLIGDVRGLGLVMGIELVEDRVAKTPATAATDRILYRALERGLSFKTTMGCVLTLTPPLTVTMAQMGQALDIIEACIADEEL